MFTNGLIELARRKERLIARAEQQRIAIAVTCLKWRKPLGVVDRGVAIAHFLKAHPLVLGAGLAVAAVIGRRNLLRWAGRGVLVWRAWRSVHAWMRKFGA